MTEVYNTVNNSYSGTQITKNGNAPLSTPFPDYPDSNVETTYAASSAAAAAAAATTATTIPNGTDVVLCKKPADGPGRRPNGRGLHADGRRVSGRRTVTNAVFPTRSSGCF